MSTPDPHESRAVLVGVSRYRDEPNIPFIPAARNNVVDLARVFTDVNRWGLPADHCETLINPTNASEVSVAIARAAEAAADTLLVYLVGHGLVSRNGELVIAMGDTRLRWPQFTGLRYSWIREAVLTSAVRRSIAIIDCCFSGRAIAAMSDASTLIAGQMEISGAYVLTSAPANAPAVAPVGAVHTAFTGTLIKIFDQGIPNGSELLRLTDIYDYARKEMIRSGYPQPMQMGTNRVGELPLIRNRAIGGGLRHVSDAPGLRAIDGESREVGKDNGIVLAFTVPSYSDLPRLEQVDTQLQFVDILDTSAKDANVDKGAWFRRPLSGGELIVLPNDVETVTVIKMMEAFGNELRRINATRSPRTILQVKAAINNGLLYDAGNAFAGAAVAEAVKMLDIPALRQLLSVSEVDLAVLISSTIFEQAVHDVHGGLESEMFYPVETEYENRVRACYVWTPNQKIVNWRKELEP